MKTLIMGIALIASINVFAQESQTANESQKQDATLQKSQPEGLALVDNKVFLTENGVTKEVKEEIWTRNGMKITPSGTLIFPTGEKAKLQQGDFVSLTGAVARPVPIGTEVASK